MFNYFMVPKNLRQMFDVFIDVDPNREIAPP